MFHQMSYNTQNIPIQTASNANTMQNNQMQYGLTQQWQQPAQMQWEAVQGQVQAVPNLQHQLPGPTSHTTNYPNQQCLMSLNRFNSQLILYEYQQSQINQTSPQTTLYRVPGPTPQNIPNQQLFQINSQNNTSGRSKDLPLGQFIMEDSELQEKAYEPNEFQQILP